MSDPARSRTYDLEDRTLQFAAGVRAFVKLLPHTPGNREDVRQLVRASGAVGANYIEANDALGDKDFPMRIKISRREAKEARYWLRLVDVDGAPGLDKQRDELLGEAMELIRILSAIANKVRNRHEDN